MRNRPHHDWRSSSERRRPIDEAPAARLLALFVLMTLPLAVIAVRTVYVQTAIADRFADEPSPTIESFEPIPSRDGRILSADGQVLAYDEPRFDLLVHYRWLEEPADERWLTDQARARLPEALRRNRERLAQAKDDVLLERARKWRSFAELAGLPADDLQQTRRAIQSRVETIAASVESARQRRTRSVNADASESQDLPWWQAAWNVLVRELTTPPHRVADSPLVIAEELQYHLVLEDVPLQVVSTIESLPSRFPDVQVRMSTERIYPLGRLASHLVGTRRALTEEEVTARRQRFPQGDPLAYEPGDRIGRTGIERASDRVLRGIRGVRRVVRDREGVIVHTAVDREPVDGQDVVLTFDASLQAAAERILDRALGDLPPEPLDETNGDSPEPTDGDVPSVPPRGGVIVAVDVRTGAVLAAAAGPRIDLARITSGSVADWTAATQDQRQPFFPRVTQATLPPGSVFKVITAVAALESGLIPANTPFYCQGYLDRPDRDRCYIYRHFGVGHGNVDLSSALCQSCNVYFFQAARQIGPGPIAEWAQRFGLGETSGAEIPGEKPGHLPQPPVGGRKNEPWYPGTTLQFAIGQASLTVTPLQVARMMAAIANDGELVTPHFIQQRLPVAPEPGASPETARGPQLALASFVDETFVSSGRRIEGLSPQTLATIRQGLFEVVHSPRGTGRQAHLDDIPIAGKTGTAEVGDDRPDHAWFAGYVPADAPRVAFVVLLEHGGSGGAAAGPVARQFVQALRANGAL